MRPTRRRPTLGRATDAATLKLAGRWATTRRVDDAAGLTRAGRWASARRGWRDDGSATVLVLAIGLLTVMVGMASAAIGSAIVARHRAQSAADLGALAGAARAIEGADTACERAADVVSRNRAEMTACVLDGSDITVTARVRPDRVARLAGSASASARAGPVTPPRP